MVNVSIYIACMDPMGLIPSSCHTICDRFTDLPTFGWLGLWRSFLAKAIHQGGGKCKNQIRLLQPYCHFSTPTANPKPCSDWLKFYLRRGIPTGPLSNSLDSWIAALGSHHVPKKSCFNHWWLPTFSKLPVVQGDHIHLRHERFKMLLAQRGDRLKVHADHELHVVHL
jgi:hypothetical protein